ncbi:MULTISPECIES: DedA family protein [unclassified Nocardioides]|uniref:DedA family protein n=1 Tax=unclassified Nocardioides TaxID=2615069 RepID=UPI000AFE8D6A|nr:MULTISPECIES: VTT domain-containing protein [unclassified Nocardioides]
MTALLASPHLNPMLFGIKWMDPDWLLSEFGSSLIWLSLVIVFIECGLFFPFLPGDTLLFALGLFIAGGQIHVLGIGTPFVELVVAVVLLTTAALLGNIVGYEIGRAIGPPLYNRDGRILKRKYFDDTSAFFEKHGSKALVIGRFVPFVRTYITVVAGVTRMDRRKFFSWSLVGAALWVVSITLLGYFLGNVPRVGPFLSENIDYAIFVILLFTVIPIGFEAIKRRRHHHAERDAARHTDNVTVPDLPEESPAG